MGDMRISGTTVEERVKQVIAVHLSVDMHEVTPQATLRDDLGGDSLDMVEIVMALEEAFHIHISDEDGDKMKTVADAVKLVEKMAVKQ